MGFSFRSFSFFAILELLSLPYDISSIYNRMIRRKFILLPGHFLYPDSHYICTVYIFILHRRIVIFFRNNFTYHSYKNIFFRIKS